MNLFGGTHDAIVVESVVEVWDLQAAADEVRASLGAEVSAVIDTGRRLIELKERTPHGQWYPLLKAAGLAKSRAAAYMQIAAHPALSNLHHGGDLPQSWRTLSVLAQLPPDMVEAHIGSGGITPDMTRAQAQEIVDEWNAPDPALVSELQVAVRAISTLAHALSEQRRDLIPNYPWHIAHTLEPTVTIDDARQARAALDQMIQTLENA